MSNFSYLAIKTIIFFEIKSYLSEFQFNIIAPLINTLIFVFIISTINSYYSFVGFDGQYIKFLIPGIVISVIMQTSYNHLSELIIRMKQVGSFETYLMSPISRVEIFISLIISSLFVCFIVVLINLFALSFFVNFNINYFILFYYLLITIIIFSSLGAITGFLSFTWDAKSLVSDFFIMPISFLSGTFFTINSIEMEWQFLFKYNPFYFLVNGFRSAFIDTYRLNLFENFYIFFIFLLVFIISVYIFKKGFKVIS